MEKSYEESPSVEVAPRSPHHAAMLLLEQRAGTLSNVVGQLERSLAPAMRQPEPESGGTKSGSKNVPSSEMVAHADSICEQVDSCIYRLQDALERLVI